MCQNVAKKVCTGVEHTGPMSMKTHLTLYVNQYPEKIAALLQGHGFACQPVGKWASELAHQVQMRLSPRMADEVWRHRIHAPDNRPDHAIGWLNSDLGPPVINMGFDFDALLVGGRRS